MLRRRYHESRRTDVRVLCSAGNGGRRRESNAAATSSAGDAAAAATRSRERPRMKSPTPSSYEVKGLSCLAEKGDERVEVGGCHQGSSMVTS
nr:hypothetical protein Iba_chr04eCG20190 [Ipomoea batatas]